MAYNNGFPIGYPYQQYQYQQPQMMTPPTIRAEIIQVGSEAEAANYPVAAGATQMLMLRDDSAICIKSAFANGQSNMIVYERRAQKQPVNGPDFVTRDEFEARLRELSAQRENALKRPETALNGEGEK